MSDQAPMSGDRMKGLNSGDDGGDKKKGKGLISTKKKNDNSDSSSSIGQPSSDDSDHEDAQSKDTTKTESSLDCLAVLEKSLPIKRGLSCHYDGKSKSFGSLTDLTSIGNIKEIEKEEHIVNKKRRLSISKKLGTRPLYDGSSSATADKNEDGEEDNTSNEGQEHGQDQGKSEN